MYLNNKKTVGNLAISWSPSLLLWHFLWSLQFFYFFSSKKSVFFLNENFTCNIACLFGWASDKKQKLKNKVQIQPFMRRWMQLHPVIWYVLSICSVMWVWKGVVWSEEWGGMGNLIPVLVCCSSVFVYLCVVNLFWWVVS